MSNRGIISFILLIILFVTLRFTNPSKEKHLELLKTKMADAYAADMGNDTAFSNHFEYNDYYFFSLTTDQIGDMHETTSVGVLGFVF
jgi:hypothetical protein